MGCRHSRPSRCKRAEKVEETQTELLETLDKEGRILEGRHEEAGQALQTSIVQEKDSSSVSVQEAKASSQNSCAVLASSQEATHAQMNKVEGSILSQLYKNHIQDYGSPGPFWEQELESLHHVIEMKNERIHELERQLLLLEMLKEKNLILALKNTTLRQEVEDLQFQAGNRLTVSSQEVQFLNKRKRKQETVHLSRHAWNESVLKLCSSGKIYFRTWKRSRRTTTAAADGGATEPSESFGPVPPPSYPALRRTSEASVLII